MQPWFFSCLFMITVSSNFTCRFVFRHPFFRNQNHFVGLVCCSVSFHSDGTFLVTHTFAYKQSVNRMILFVCVSRCSRQHPRPTASQTLLIPNMFQDVRLTEVMLDEKDQDVGLEVNCFLLLRAWLSRSFSSLNVSGPVQTASRIR